MRKLFTTILLGTVCHAALACNEPSHICVVGYSPTMRYDVVGVVGQPTLFTFPVGEKIYRIVLNGKAKEDGNIGDSAWNGPPPPKNKEDEAQPLGNNMYLTPGIYAADVTSIANIITIRQNPPDCTIEAQNCEQKAYAFSLHALPATTSDDKMENVTFNLIFKGTTTAPTPTMAAGPQQAVKVATHPWTPPAKAETQAAAEEHLRLDAFNGSNGGEKCPYHAHGPANSSITPRCPLTNGQFVVMRFPGLTHKPTVYVVTGKDDERLARQHANAEFIVIEEIDPHFRLRLGNEVLDIVADQFDAIGKDPGTGTIAPAVTRDLISAKK